jgi:hypothetical protein
MKAKMSELKNLPSPKALSAILKDSSGAVTIRVFRSINELLDCLRRENLIICRIDEKGDYSVEELKEKLGENYVV